MRPNREMACAEPEDSDVAGWRRTLRIWLILAVAGAALYALRVVVS